MAAPNSVEIGLITEFRKRFNAGELKDEQTTDTFLIRWIRARNHKLDKAEKMLRKYLKWRQVNDIDNILSWEPPQEIKELAPTRIIGHDVDNCPIVLFKSGKTNFLKIVKSGMQDIFQKYCDQFYEKLEQEMRGLKQRDGTPVSQFIWIEDLKGFKLKTIAHSKVVDIFLKFGKSFESNHPEMLKKFYGINTGKAFPIIWTIIKPILQPATKNKISAYNKSSKWKPILQQNIPLDALPKAYGGNNSDLDTEGADVDEDDEDDLENEFMAMILPKGDKVKLIFEIEEKNSVIQWAFKTDKGPMELLVHSISESKVYETKLDSNLKLVEGSVKCGAVGDYELIFSNFDDSLEAQELQYRISIKSA